MLRLSHNQGNAYCLLLKQCIGKEREVELTSRSAALTPLGNRPACCFTTFSGLPDGDIPSGSVDRVQRIGIICLANRHRPHLRERYNRC